MYPISKKNSFYQQVRYFQKSLPAGKKNGQGFLFVFIQTNLLRSVIQETNTKEIPEKASSKKNRINSKYNPAFSKQISLSCTKLDHYLHSEKLFQYQCFIVNLVIFSWLPEVKRAR